MVIASAEPQADPFLEPGLMLPPIASFWRRLAAWIVDVLLLGIVGQGLGWLLSSIWFQIGPYGRVVGLLFILPYFGLMNSGIGNGQTLGKRLLKITVRDGNNQPISITSAYDLGIATGHITFGDNEPIAVWRERTGADGGQ